MVPRTVLTAAERHDEPGADDRLAAQGALAAVEAQARRHDDECARDDRAAAELPPEPAEREPALDAPGPDPAERGAPDVV